MTAETTRTLYARLATERPVKARRYRASILDTLARDNIHPIERERLTEALAGIADVLGSEVTCQRCGATLTDPHSQALGYGPVCQDHMAEAS